MHHAEDLEETCESIPVRIKSLRPGANGYLYLDDLKSTTTNQSQIFTMRNAEHIATKNLGSATVWNVRVAKTDNIKKGINSQYVTFENEAESKYLNGGRSSMFATNRRNVFVNSGNTNTGFVWQIDPIL